MPEYLAPGVYVEEITHGPRPIEGVGTSTAGFVGLTERGPARPRLVTSWLEYCRCFGDVADSSTSFLPFAVRGFFDNGGARLYIARVTRSDAAQSQLDLGTANPGQHLRISANGPGAWGDRILVRIADSTGAPGGSAGFQVSVLQYFDAVPDPFVDPLDPAINNNPGRVEPDLIKHFDNLVLDPRDDNYIIDRINGSSTVIEVEWSDNNLAPARPGNTAFRPLINGRDGVASLSAGDYEGDVATGTGLAGLGLVDEIAVLCVPDEVHPSLDHAGQAQLTHAVVDQCERKQDRFAVLQVKGGQQRVQDITPLRDSSYAAIYYPWIRVMDLDGRDTLLVPPGGHVAGIYARTDQRRGVHKAPANEVVQGIVDHDIDATRKPLEFTLGNREQDILNPLGVNMIRDFRSAGRGILVWGTRTLSSDPEFRYINVRRLLMFLEESIDKGTQWVVFEPNDPKTWARLTHAVSGFLQENWRAGALQGATEREAYFVKCGRETMTQDDIDNGRLICEIGVAPVRPAEFVIFRIGQKTADS